jgi:hypothetical protein
MVVFADGSATPTATITDGITEPDSLAVAPNGWLYVSNAAGSSSSSGGNVTVYLPARTNARFTIAKGISIPVALGIN